VVARDGGTPQRSATMETVVMVMDANDHAPRFVERQYTFDVREDVDVGTVIGRVSATDDDHGHNALVTYSFSRRSQVQSEVSTLEISFIERPVVRRTYYSRKNQEVLFNFNADLTGSGSVPICM